MSPPRITFRHILNSILKVFKLEKGVFYTIRELSLRPAQAIRTYLQIDRSRMQDPIKFLFVMVAFAALVFIRTDLKQSSQNFQDGVTYGSQSSANSISKEQMAEINTRAGRAMDFMTDNYQLLLIFSIPFSTFWSFLHFRKKEWNAAEHLVINSYVFGYQSGLYAVLKVFEYLLDLNPLYMSIPYLFLSLGYAIFVYVRIFDVTAFRGSLLSLWVLIVSMVTYMISFSAILSLVALL